MELFSNPLFSNLRLSFTFFALILIVGQSELRRLPSKANDTSLIYGKQMPHQPGRILPHKVTQPSKTLEPSRLSKRTPKISCDPLPLNNQTWNSLELDTYLKGFPNGDKITLVDYAASVGAQNFVCGIGFGCLAGQLCVPVNDPDWYILFAIQQWNSQMNAMYTAIGIAVQVVADDLTEMINKLFPASDASGIIHAKQSIGISAAMSEIGGTIMMDAMVFFGMVTGPVGWAMNLLNFGISAGLAIWAYSMKEPPAPIRNGFDEYTHIHWYLDQMQTNAQTAVSEAVKKVLHAPISSKDGISDVLKGGQYMNPLTLPTLAETKAHLTNVTLALGLNFMFSTMDAFITVGADYCNDKGPNGAWPQKDRLSYCSTPGGPMHNIILAKGDKSENGFRNADIIAGLWGFTTEMITRVSIDCQTKHKKFRYNPYTGDKFPKSYDDECVFNLPVCDCQHATAKGTWDSIHKHHRHVAEACRKHGGLPI